VRACRRAPAAWLRVAIFLCAANVHAATRLPPELSATLGASGLPMASYGLHVQAVDGDATLPLVSLNAERPFLLASTTKLVTSLAALDLLGARAGWRAEPIVRPAHLLDPRSYSRGTLVVAVQPGAGSRAVVTLHPHPSGVSVVSDVYMGGGCSAWARWREDRPGTLWVRGRWDASCGKREIALMRLHDAAVPAVRVSAIASRVPAGSDVRSVIHEMNKTSDNAIARSLLLQMSSQRVQEWLRTQGLDDDDIHIDQGSGQSRVERGKPRAMVDMLRRAWRRDADGSFLDSLPVAGVDGTLAHRLRAGPAAGRAWLKTGTLSDTRALAGYVRGASGTVYAVAAYVNHARASHATPTLDALIEWIARNG
jgi:D-alanyl-D-alanine carboxypeptidase/D-alanyl-D-alanine-endopeptidase (penicillin-binding protein 4)